MKNYSMFNLSNRTKRFVSAIALSTSLIAGLQHLSLAQGNPGLTLWSGVERENILNYHLDFGGRPNQWERYRLRIPANKMESGASKFIITYPDYYDGVFDKDKIEVTYGDKYRKTAKIREINWNRDTQRLEIELEEAIAPKTRVELKLSNVRNPRFGGTYYFNAQVIPADQFPVPLYVGTWILSIER
jgi:hypothetical protein